MHKMRGAIKLLLCTIPSHRGITSSLSVGINFRLPAYMDSPVCEHPQQDSDAKSVLRPFAEVVNVLVLKS